MPNRLADRLRALGTALLHLVPALVLLGVAAFVTHPAILVLLLAANSLAMAAICHAIGFGSEAGFVHGTVRRGAAHFLSLVTYSGLVMLLIGGPLWWLLNTPSLPAVLAVTTTTVLALLLLWRWWPTFGLLFVWDDAYVDAPDRSWLLGAMQRSLSFAGHLTEEQDVYFTHGLPAGIALLVCVQGALSLAGLCGLLPSEFRITALALYGVLMPLAHLVVANRTLRLLLRARRARHADSQREAPAQEPDCAAPPSTLPGGLSSLELNAALLRAARCGHTELALAALERGADPNAVPAPEERDQRSVLVLAALLPEIRLLRALISKGADVNRNHGGLTALLAATRDSLVGRPDAVLTLLANGADPAATDFAGNTPLHHAALASDATVAAMLLDAQAPLGACNRDALTPLGAACAAANWTLVRFLLERGARLDVEHAQPALAAAAGIAEDDPTGVKLLLKQRAKVDARGPLGRAALHTAALHGHAGIVRCLCDAGAQVNLADSHGTTALMEAARAGAAAVIEELAARRADPNLVDHGGRSALVIACQSAQANVETVRGLLALGASLELATRDGKRALDCAVAAGRWDLVAVLDPKFPLPANVAEVARAAPLAGADSPAHLLDALRFGHYDIAAGFARRLRDWPPGELVALWQELRLERDPRPRAWLLAHGLRVDAADTAGRSLLETAIDDLPQSLSACSELLAAGAPTGGPSGLRLLDAARDFPDHRAELLALAQTAFERGADPYATTLQGETCQHVAASLGAGALLDWLLARGNDPNARDAQARTPLHAALTAPAEADVEHLVRSLVRHGAAPDAAASHGETCLGLALARRERGLQRWLRWPSWPLPRRRLRDSDLPAAAVAGDAGAVERLVDLGLPIDAVDAQGASALLRACGAGHRAIVELLLAAGADAELAAHSGATCLSAAVSTRHEDIVGLLVAHGVDLDRRLPGGGTPLMIAAALGHAQIARRLLEGGAAPDLADDKGTTALHAAAVYAFQHADTPGARKLFEALFAAGAAPNPRNAKGQTPLLLLLGARADPGTPCESAHLATLLPLLLDRGAALDAQDERGVGALHACAIHGLTAPAQQLLARGADRQLGDCLGRTPGEIASLLGYTELADLLGATTAIPSLAQMLRQQARQAD